jgi:hypothetical protein
MSTPEGDVVLLKDGLYRFEVSATGTELAIQKGKAKLVKDGNDLAVLKSGNRFQLSPTTSDGIVQFTKLGKEADELDRWSRRRAEFLVAANGRLTPWSIGSVSQNYPYSLRGGWLYNPYFSCYTFVPFDGRFGSPYGFSYALFCPVRIHTFHQDSPWSASNSGLGDSQRVPSMGHEQRQTVISAPSAPAARVETGRSDQDSRSGTFDRVRSR